MTVVAPVLRRAGWTAVVVLVLTFVTFLMAYEIPGDTARIAAGPGASAAQVEAQRTLLGLDKPFTAQFWDYLVNALHGRLGTSIETRTSIAHDIAIGLASSVQLVVFAMLIVVVVSVGLAALAARFQGSLLDRMIRVLCVSVGSVPTFWLGLVLQLGLAGHLHWFPVSDQAGPAAATIPTQSHILFLDALLAKSPGVAASVVTHLFLPAVTLSAFFIPVIVRTLRVNLIEEMSKEYVVLAYAKGMSPGRVLLRHALRNAALPTVTLLGLQIGWMLGNTVLVESIFGLPGIGAYAVNAVAAKDLYAVIGVVLVIGVIFVLLNLIVDLLQLLLNPRQRLSGASA